MPSGMKLFQTVLLLLLAASEHYLFCFAIKM